MPEIGPRVAHTEPTRPRPASPIRTSHTPCELLCWQGAPPKPKLSVEEARKQAEDMVRKAKERREARPRREPYHHKPTLGLRLNCLPARALTQLLRLVRESRKSQRSRPVCSAHEHPPCADMVPCTRPVSR